MARTKNLVGFALFFTAILLAAACSRSTPTPTPPPPPSQIWILAPLDGAAMPLGSHQIRMQAASFTGVADFEVQVNGELLGTYAPSQSGSGGSQYGTMFFAKATWSPQAYGEYTIQVRAKNAQDQFSPSASVDVTIGEYLAESLGPEAYQGNPGPPGIKEPWQALSTMNANCRAGPSVKFNETGFVPRGYTALVLGRNEVGTWLAINNPNGVGTCWTSLIAFEVGYDVSDLPVVDSDPEPLSEDDDDDDGGGGGGSATGCLVTNPLTGTSSCQSPCPASASGPACTP